MAAMRPISDIIKDPASHLVDVRSPAEVEEINIAGAENIPMDEVPERIEHFKNLDGDIVVFCRSGARSESVMQYLKQNGVLNVVNGGGYADVQNHLSKKS